MAEQKSQGPMILMADRLAPQVVAGLKSRGLNFREDPSLNGESLTAAIKQFNPSVLIVRSTKVQKEQLDAAKDLALIIRAGAGTNTIDVMEASRKCVYVCNTPGKNALAVAELAMGHLINLDRHIADCVADVRNGKWNKKGYGKLAKGLYGRRLAVVGAAGMIGKAVARRALSFGMTVVGADPFLTPEVAEEVGMIYAKDAKEAMTGADAVTFHVPVVPATKGMVNKEILTVLKDGAYVINTSRGEIVNEVDLLEMVAKKKLLVGADVMLNEPKATDSVFPHKHLSTNPSLYYTHHIGASTVQATEAVGDEVLRIVESYVGGLTPPNCVNTERKSPATHAMSVRHLSKPGVLALVLSGLKDEGINVLEMNNLVFKGAQACSASLSLDKAPSADMISKLSADASILNVSVAAL